VTHRATSILVPGADNKNFEVGAGSSLPVAFNEFLDRRAIDRGGYDPYSMAFIAKAAIITGDLVSDSRWEGSAWSTMMKSHGYASCCSMPIMSGSGEASGIVAVYRHEPVNPTVLEQNLIDRFAKIAGIAINRDRADEALNQARLELTHVARLATLSAMTASITHEVSQPISGVLTNANTCARMLAADPPNVAGAAETIRGRSETQSCHRGHQASAGDVHKEGADHGDGRSQRCSAGGDCHVFGRTTSEPLGLADRLR